MKKLIFAAGAALLLAACPGPMPDPATIDTAINRAVIAEAGTRLRCPTTDRGRQAVRGVRIAFDLRYAAMLTAEQSARLSEARRETNEACGL